MILMESGRSNSVRTRIREVIRSATVIRRNYTGNSRSPPVGTWDAFRTAAARSGHVHCRRITSALPRSIEPVQQRQALSARDRGAVDSGAPFHLRAVGGFLVARIAEDHPVLAEGVPVACMSGVAGHQASGSSWPTLRPPRSNSWREPRRLSLTPCCQGPQILSAPGTSKPSTRKEFRPIVAAHRCQNGSKILADKDLWK